VQPVPTEVFWDAFPEWCLGHYQRVAPLQRWLVDVLPG
jgi:hypothetical protein